MVERQPEAAGSDLRFLKEGSNKNQRMNIKENLPAVLGHRVVPGANCVVPYLWEHEEAHGY